MDHDDGVYLVDTLSGSNSDENEIDSDLEDKLYAAVFHSNDILSTSRDIPGYNNFTTLTDIRGLWKNIPDRNTSTLDLVNARNTFNDVPKIAQKDKINFGGEGISNEGYAKDFEALKIATCQETTDSTNCKSSKHGEKDRNHAKDIFENENRFEESWVSESPSNNKSHNVAADKDLTIDLYGSRELVCEIETVQRKDVLEERGENACRKDKNSPQTKIIKKQRISLKKLSKSKDSPIQNSPLTSARRSDTPNEADTRAINYFRDDLAHASAPEDQNKSSDIKPEDKLGEDQSVEKERISSFGDTTLVTEEVSDRPSSIKPEEELENLQSTECEVVGEESENRTEVKPEEEFETVKPIENEGLLPSSDSSSSDSSGDSSTSSSGQDTWVVKAGEEPDKTISLESDYDEIIMLDDSEGSICEIPVPPKPRPPTITLEDSESSTSSDSDAISMTMSPKKLVESYRMAISESSFRKQKSGGRLESVALNKTRLQRRTAPSLNIFTSNSDDSMTENEQANSGFIAGNQINKDKSTQSSGSSATISQIIDNFSTDAEQQGTSCAIMDYSERSTEAISEGYKSPIRESQGESFGHSESTKKMNNDISSNNLLVVENHLGETESPLSPIEQTLPENNEKGKNAENNQNLAEVNTIIINAESVQRLPSFEENTEAEIMIRTPENRKRCMVETGGKKSKNQSPSKKAKSSDDPAASRSSGIKSLKHIKENKDKQRNRAADYFFKPMTSEMEDYYNKSWGGENFDIDAIRKQMPRDPRHWAVLNEDLLGYQQRRSRYWTESKCRNCNQSGHKMAECPENKKVPTCHMCGLSGHREPRCPHKMCLGCGKKQKFYMQVCNGCRRAWCKGCQSYGHVEDSCPDLWRRYHLTTSYRDVSTQLNAADVMKPQNQLSCCNCAKRGHDSTTCDNYRWSRHFPTPSYVTNYNSGPAYTEHIIIEDVDHPSKARDQTEKEQTHIDTEVRGTSLSSNELKKRKSNIDKVTNANPVVDESLQTRTTDVDENINKTREQSKDQSQYNQGKTQKVNELLSTNSETTKSEEVLLTLKSKILGTKAPRFSSFDECTVRLSAKQCKGFVNSESSRQFLFNLTTQFPIKLEIKRFQNGEVAMMITGTRDLHHPIALTITDWLKRRSDEQSRFIKLNLPMAKDQLMKLLSEKLEELKHDIGDPIKIYETLQKLKAELRSLRRQSKAGKKMATCSRRARVVEELATSQCKLNMILFGQSKIRKAEKSCRYLRNALSAMQKLDSPSQIRASTYLEIVHHYNIIFAPYTPDNIQDLLDFYWQKYSGEHVSRKKKQQGNRSSDIAYENLIKSLNTTNRIQDTISSFSTESTVSPNTSNEVLASNSNPARVSSNSTINSSANYRGVESQFTILQAGFSDRNVNFNSNSPHTRFPVMYDLDRLENNYYNSQYDFGNNSNSKRKGDTRGIQRNHQQEDYIGLDNSSLQNNHYNVEKDLSNVGGCISKRTRGRYLEKIPMKNLKEWMNNEFLNSPRGNIQSNSSLGGNKWQDNYAPRDISLRDMFFSDTQPESSPREFHHIDRLDIVPRNEAEKRFRFNADVPSTSGTRNQLILTAGNKPGSVNKKQKIGNNNNKKKKRNKGTKLPSYLQKRAVKNIAKYMNLGFPCIVQAATELQKKLSSKSLTLQCVQKFEGLVKRKLKKKDYLL